MTEKKKILIAGGGASGMMAALAASGEGAEVTLLEQNDCLGKKILSTGNGRCNFTNMKQEPSCYRGEDPDFAWRALGRFSALETIAFFTNLGIYSRNREGCLYPYSGQAQAVRKVLAAQVQAEGVRVLTNRKVTEIRPRGNGFRIRAEETYEKGKTREETWEADAVILACGSRASRISGSDGSGYRLAESLGHSLVPVLPALVQLKADGWPAKLAGVRARGKVSLYVDGELAGEDGGELQLTEYGISGIPVFQVSRYAARGLSEKKEVLAELDFLPDFTPEALLDFLTARAKRQPWKRADLFLTGLFSDRLGAVLLRKAGIRERQKAGEISPLSLKDLVLAVKQFPVQIRETCSFDQAQVCCGGVRTSEVKEETMESRLVPGLYFAGEILDVDGMCGGYNLQWAWTSGYLAGKGAAHA